MIESSYADRACDQTSPRTLHVAAVEVWQTKNSTCQPCVLCVYNSSVTDQCWRGRSPCYRGQPNKCRTHHMYLIISAAMVCDVLARIREGIPDLMSGWRLALIGSSLPGIDPLRIVRY